MRKLISLWLLSLLIVAALAAAATAQVLRTPPTLVTSADIAFRIEGKDPKGRPVGTLMLRMNGDWVPVSNAVQPSPALTSR